MEKINNRLNGEYNLPEPPYKEAAKQQKRELFLGRAIYGLIFFWACAWGVYHFTKFDPIANEKQTKSIKNFVQQRDEKLSPELNSDISSKMQFNEAGELMIISTP